MLFAVKNKVSSVLFLLKWVWLLLVYVMLFWAISRAGNSSRFQQKGEKVIWVSPQWNVHQGITRLY